MLGENINPAARSAQTPMGLVNVSPGGDGTTPFRKRSNNLRFSPGNPHVAWQVRRRITRLPEATCCVDLGVARRSRAQPFVHAGRRQEGDGRGMQLWVETLDKR